MICFNVKSAPPSGAHLVGVLSYNRKVAGLIPGQVPCLGCGFDSPSGRCNFWFRHIQKATNRCFSLESMFLSLPFSLKAMTNCSEKDKNRTNKQ